MCFYCHKLYMFPYAPPHGHETCPELEKIKNNYNIKSNITDTKTVQNFYNKNIPVSSINKKIEI